MVMEVAEVHAEMSRTGVPVVVSEVPQLLVPAELTEACTRLPDGIPNG
jgi:hypothetical protein